MWCIAEKAGQDRKWDQVGIAEWVSTELSAYTVYTAGYALLEEQCSGLYFAVEVPTSIGGMHLQH